MPQAKIGTTLLLHYTAMLEDGTVIDSTAGGDPVRVTVGQRRIVPGLDEVLEGMGPGESKTVTIPAAKAFGEHRDELVVKMDRDNPPVEPRRAVEAADTILRGDTPGVLFDGRLTVDENPALAGKDIIFNIDVVDIVT